MPPESVLFHRIVAGVGLFVMIGLAWLMSSHRRRFPWRVVIGGLLTQIILVNLILGTDHGRSVFTALGDGFETLLGFVDEGCKLVFSENFADFYFAFRVLPTIIFFSSLMAVMYHLGVMQCVVSMLAKVLQRTLGTSGAESLSAAANIFVGQTEAPFVVRP
ncbi:MAG TPA: NupC/NupG family nucleoside CNT transporter, partial [Planctomycetes bacterium]|nr:NupC/NupG family nucleoside CNT transporter [Planctomycetota bacterium]